MKKIREQHGLQPIGTPAYNKFRQSDSSSDLSSEDDMDQTSGVEESSNTSLSQSMTSDRNPYGQPFQQKRQVAAPFSHPKYNAPRQNLPSHVEMKRASPMT